MNMKRVQGQLFIIPSREFGRRGCTSLEPRAPLERRDECAVSLGISAEHQHGGAILELGLADRDTVTSEYDGSRRYE